MRVYMMVLLVGLAVTMVATPVVRRVALAMNIVTPLRSRDVHAYPIPRLGGIAITGGIVTAMVFGYSVPFLRPIYEQSTVLWAVVAGAMAITVLGVIDDVWELDWLAKLAGQFLITGGMATAGVQLINIPLFGVTIGSARSSVVLSMLVLVAIINAVNFVDGLDGLAAGVIAIGSIGFFSYSYLLSRLMGATSYATAAAVVTVALAGAALGFLWYNYHPASIFMGDSGSMVLGLMLGSATIVVTGQVNPAILSEQSFITPWVPLLLPAAVLLIPLTDLMVTPMLRVMRGKSPVSADRSHLHHRLLGQGHSHRGVVFIMYAWTALACLVAVTLILLPPRTVLMFALPILLAVILATMYQFPARARRHTAMAPRRPRFLQDDGQAVISRPPLENTWFPVNHFALPMVIVDEDGSTVEGGRSHLYPSSAAYPKPPKSPGDRPNDFGRGSAQRTGFSSSKLPLSSKDKS